MTYDVDFKKEFSELWNQTRAKIGNPVFAGLSNDDIEKLKKHHPDIYRTTFPMVVNSENELFARYLTPIEFLEYISSDVKEQKKKAVIKMPDIKRMSSKQIRRFQKLVKKADFAAAKGMAAILSVSVADFVIANTLEVPFYLNIIPATVAAMFLMRPRIIERQEEGQEQPQEARPSILQQVGGLSLDAGDHYASEVSSAAITRQLDLNRRMLANSAMKNEAGYQTELRNMQDQAKQALRDETPFVIDGVASGILEEKGLMAAPNKGSFMGSTVGDWMKTHMLILGQSGLGKTELAKIQLAQMLKHAKDNNIKFGTLICCEKGVLPYDMFPVYADLGLKFTIISDKVVKFKVARHKRFDFSACFRMGIDEQEQVMIEETFKKNETERLSKLFAETPNANPADYEFRMDDYAFEVKETISAANIALIQNMDPKEVATVVEAVALKDDASFWDKEFTNMFRAACFVAKLVADYGPSVFQKKQKHYKWTLLTIYNLLNDPDYFCEAVKTITPVRLARAIQDLNEKEQRDTIRRQNLTKETGSNFSTEKAMDIFDKSYVQTVIGKSPSNVYIMSLQMLKHYHVKLMQGDAPTSSSQFTNRAHMLQFILDKFSQQMIDVEYGINILDVCRGGHIGIAMPPSSGKAGQLVTSLMRSQLQFYRESIADTMTDGGNKKEATVFYFHDEVQASADLPKLTERIDRFRSMRVLLCFLTQTTDAILDTFMNKRGGKDGQAFVSQAITNFGKIIMFRSSEHSEEKINAYLGDRRFLVPCKDEKDIPIALDYPKIARNLMLNADAHERLYVEEISNLEHHVNLNYSKAKSENDNAKAKNKFDVDNANKASSSVSYGDGKGSFSSSSPTQTLELELGDSGEYAYWKKNKETLDRFIKEAKHDRFLRIHRGWLQDYPRNEEELANMNKVNERVLEKYRMNFLCEHHDKLFSDDNREISTALKSGQTALNITTRANKTMIADVMFPLQYWRDKKQILGI